MTTLEICTPSFTSVLEAQTGGADRIELCQNLELGGTTPSFALLKLTREVLNIPIAVLIRPRGGDFIYTPDDQQVMKKDIEFCRQLGVEAVVVGALTAQGSLDETLCRRFVDLAYPLDVVFHRAIDKCLDPLEALHQLIDWGYQRILTSGQAQQAPEGRTLIQSMVLEAGGRITIMAGGGLTPDNLADFIRYTQVTDVHLSAKKTVRSLASTAGQVSLATPGLPENDYLQTDATTVRQIKNILNHL